jgi:uncharacterized protein YfeS
MRELAHPKALEYLDDDLFFDTSNEFCPFGSDEGSCGFHILKKWKQDSNKIEGLVLHTLKRSKISVEEFENVFSSNDRLIDEVDWMIIAFGFGEILLEGAINAQVLHFVRIAIKRQMRQEVLLELCSGRDELMLERHSILQKELDVLQNPLLCVG